MTNERSLMELMVARRSCRSYRDEALPRPMIETLLEAGRLAPSACNRQPWRFAVVQDAALRGRVVEEGFLPGLHMQWAATAPVLLVLGLERDWITHRWAAGLSGVDYAWLDAGIVGEHMVLQAEALGLGTCWIGWVRARPLRRLIGWPHRVRPVAVIPVGWPAETPSARPRKSLDELTTWR
jgi:nitroreductase